MTVETMDAHEELKARAKEMKLNIPGLDDMPIFGTCPVFVQLEPGKRMQVPNRKYTMVSDDGGEEWHPVVEVSDKYVLMEHEVILLEMVKKIETIRKIVGEPKINLRYQKHGARMFNDITFPNAPVNANGDKIVPSFRMYNSVDLSSPLGGQNRAIRLKCANGLMVPDERFPTASFSKRHIGSDVDEFMHGMLESVEHLVEGIQMWDGWSQKSISSSAYIEALEEIGFTDNQQEKIVNQGLRGFDKWGDKSLPTVVDCFKKGNGDTDLWLAYNSVTQFITDNTENIQTEGNRSAKTSKVFELLAE